MRLTHQVEIDADPERVHAALVDVQQWPEWTASTRHAERLDDGPLAVGSTVKLDQPGLRQVVWRVVSLTPPEGFAWTSRVGGVTTVGDHRITPIGDHRVRVDLSVDQTGVLAPLVGLLYGRLTRRYMRLEAEGLKRRCEPGG